MERLRALWKSLRQRDIAFHLLAFFALAAAVLMLVLIGNGTHARALEQAQGLHRYALHWSVVIVPLAAAPVAILCDREQDTVWRQVKLWAIAMLVLGVVGYWFSQVVALSVSAERLMP